MPAAVTDAELARTAPVVAVSPHLDDAVFGCGQWLALHPGSWVVTVFAGRPSFSETTSETGSVLTEWDAAGGFGVGDDVVAARREEDRAALAILGARPVWLEFCDSQYGLSPTAQEVAAPLEAAIVASGATSIAIPLGLFHSDHALTHAACLIVMRRRPGPTWLAYEEALYRTLPKLVDMRLRELSDAGIEARAAFSLRTEEQKRSAVEEYRSQLRALSTPGRLGHQDAFQEERFWRLKHVPPRRAGPERPNRR